MASEDLMNVIPQTGAEAEELINKFYNEAGTEKNWFGNDEEFTKELPKEPTKGFDLSKIDPKYLGKDQAKKPGEPAPVAANPFEYEFDGQKVVFDQEQARKYAETGYKAEQKYNEIIKEQQKIAQERAQFEAKRGQYEHMAKLDEWAKANPELYNRLALEHENMANGGQYGDVPPYLTKFVSDLDAIKSRFAEIDSFQTAQKNKASDQALDQEIVQFKQQHPQFDWNDKALEQKILIHATQNNKQSFRAAARDLLFDDLIKRTELKAKEAVGKEIQKNSKLGEIPKRSDSNINYQKQINVKKMTWDQIGESVKKSYGL